MNRALIELAADLHRRHRPFVIATVVWARGPSSGKQGSAAIIEADQRVHGWIGGACAEPAVLREARRVLNDGDPRLMYLGPADELDGSERESVVTVPISCSSEGAMEVFMEPVLPSPHVVIIGKSPSVHMLTRLLAAMEWRTSVVDDGGDGSGYGPEVGVVTSLDEVGSLEVTDTTAIVVATQGHYDEAAVEAALATEAPYVGLVASDKRAETVLGYLRDRGYGEPDLRRIHTPAGLDLGHIEHREIAVAILAQLVSIRASGGIGGAPAASSPLASAVDPVCGMTVDVDAARFASEYGGVVYYFCCQACNTAFDEHPSDHLHAAQ